jgi:hypothetical protein
LVPPFGATFAPQHPILQQRGWGGMRFGSRYRDLPKFVWRRLDRMAGEVNAFLVVAALSLAMLDFLCLGQKFIYALPPAIQVQIP